MVLRGLFELPHRGKLLASIRCFGFLVAVFANVEASEDTTSEKLPVWILSPASVSKPVIYDGEWRKSEDGKDHGLIIDGRNFDGEVQLFLQLEQAGGMEVWVDGLFMGNAGQPGTNADDEQAVLRNEIPFPLTISAEGSVLLELRHSRFAADKLSGITGQSGDIQLRLIPLALWMRELQKQNNGVRAPLVFFIAVPGMFALLHFSFAGLKLDRVSILTVDAFMLSLAALSSVRLMLATTVSVDAYVAAYRGFLALIPVVSILGLKTVYGLLGFPRGTIYKVPICRGL